MRSTIDLPDDESLAAFEYQAEPAYAYRVELSLQNRTLVETRDTLLPQLMSGKLRVRDAERTMSEVL